MDAHIACIILFVCMYIDKFYYYFENLASINTKQINKSNRKTNSIWKLDFIAFELIFISQANFNKIKNRIVKTKYLS